MISQLEIIHKLGYTHGDINLKNICYNKEACCYSIIDFAMAKKIYNKNGNHKEKVKQSEFHGNFMYGSESMVNKTSISRKDELESMMYILCFLYSGTLPIIEWLNKNIERIHMKHIFEEICKYRIEKKKEYCEQVTNLLPPGFKQAFQYILLIDHKAKPDYNLIKLWFANNKSEEKKAFTSALNIKN